MRLPKSLHAQAVRLAEADGVSLNTFLVAAVAAQVEAKGLAGDVIGGIKEMMQEMEQRLAKHTTQQGLKIAASFNMDWTQWGAAISTSGSVMDRRRYIVSNKSVMDRASPSSIKVPLNALLEQEVL